MQDRVYTAALALIKVNGRFVLKTQNIRVTEQFQRGEIQGIGNVATQELPILKWMGTATATVHLIRYVGDAFGAVNGNVSNYDTYFDILRLAERGVTIDLFKRVSDAIDPATQIPTVRIEPFISIRRAFIESKGLALNEGQSATNDFSFKFLDPILQNVT